MDVEILKEYESITFVVFVVKGLGNGKPLLLTTVSFKTTDI